MIRRALILAVLALCVIAPRAFAQQKYALVDSTIYVFAAPVDSPLVGQNIFDVLGDGVQVNQSEEVEQALLLHIDANTEKTLHGYRVRIFFDNAQTARTESESVVERFRSMYHDVNVYRSYVNPYFKVTVGDFRTKSEAVQLLRRIRSVFPSAFVVKENIAYPIVDTENPIREEVVQVLRVVEED